MFSSDFRAGRGAEAAGDLVEASRRYGEAGADEALLRVLRKRAELETDPRGAVQLRRQAVEVSAGYCPGEAPDRDCRAALATALMRLSAVVEPEEAKELFGEAGHLFHEAGKYELAASAYEAAGDYEAATEAHIQAGDLDAVERTAAMGAKESGPHVELLEWLDVLLDQGRVDDALKAVEEAEAEGKPQAREARELIHEKLPPRGRLVLQSATETYRLVADDVAEVGREPGLPLVLNVSAVSRRHLSLQRSGDALVVANLSSSGDVTVDGESLLAPKVLQPGGGEVRLGLDGNCALIVRPEGNGWHVQAHIGGVGGDIMLLATRVQLEGLEWSVGPGQRWRCGDQIASRGQRLGPFTVG